MKLIVQFLRQLQFTVIIFLRFTVYWCKAIHSAKDVPIYYEQGVVGDRVNLPCDISIAEGPHEIEDSVVLVLWYREDLGTPIYSVDNREKEYKTAEKWSDDRVFGHRAYFVAEKKPAQLTVDNVKPTDEGTYRCRVDFKFAQTRNSKVVLNIIVPPKKIIITDETGKARTSVIGPYTEGSTLTLTCTVFGAKPAPEVIVFKKDQILKKKTFNLTSESVSLQITSQKLTRSDLNTELTCQASNNNRTNLSAVVQIDMNFSPLDVQIFESNQPFTAGRKYDLICQSSGSRPPAKVTWWKDGKRLDKTKDTTSADGNTTTSILQFIPAKNDAGRYLSCRSENHLVNTDVLETGWKLEINYLPEARIILGSSLRSDGIKEGADVYFDCIVNALPPSFKVDWKLNGRLLHHHVGHGVIISNHSLVLQKVNRKSAGNYSCKAYNSEGEGESNIFHLNIMYSPACKPNQTRVYGVAKSEKINVTCEVEANPQDVLFKWTFNNSQESFDISPNYVIKSGTISIISHTPDTEVDYGTLLCIASNKIGQQRIPCVYHIIAAGKPDRVSNCTVWNITTTSSYLNCMEGYNGGMPQTFYVEVISDQGLEINNTSTLPRFQLSGLRANTDYVATVYAKNGKGRSEPVIARISTLANFEQILNLKEAKKPHTQFHLTTTMNIVIGVVLSLIIVACLVATALQVHCSRIENRQNKHKLRDDDNTCSSNDSIIRDEKVQNNFTEKIFFNQNIMLIDGGGSEEKEPDIIPQSIPDIDVNSDYIKKRLHVSTIEKKMSATAAANYFPDNVYSNNNYPSYCTLRNDRMEWQNYKQSNDANMLCGAVIIPEIEQFNARTLPRKNRPDK